MVLLSSSLTSSVKTTSADVDDMMVELGLLQDAVGGDDDIMDVPLCL